MCKSSHQGRNSLADLNRRKSLMAGVHLPLPVLIQYDLKQVRAVSFRTSLGKAI